MFLRLLLILSLLLPHVSCSVAAPVVANDSTAVTAANSFVQSGDRGGSRAMQHSNKRGAGQASNLPAYAVRDGVALLVVVLMAFVLAVAWYRPARRLRCRRSLQQAEENNEIKNVYFFN